MKITPRAIQQVGIPLSCLFSGLAIANTGITAALVRDSSSLTPLLLVAVGVCAGFAGGFFAAAMRR